MKKNTLLFFSFLFCSVQTPLFGQSPCLPGGIYFETQSEIDNFSTNYPGCTEVEGDVSISGLTIDNLGGLSVLTAIGGDLRVSETYSLTSLSGFENLSSIGGELRLDFNEKLTDLSGLEKLSSIERNVSILYNFELTGLNGLESLTTIGKYLLIAENPQLHGLAGLENLTYIGQELAIQDNDALTTLSALHHAVFIGGDLEISGNGLLSLCAVQAICDYLDAPTGDIIIGSNDSGCATVEEIDAACPVAAMERSQKPEIRVFPNPGSGEFEIEWQETGSGSFLLFDSVGNLLLQAPMAGNLRLDLSAFPGGLYYFQIFSEKGVFSGRVVKE